MRGCVGDATVPWGEEEKKRIVQPCSASLYDAITIEA